MTMRLFAAVAVLSILMTPPALAESAGRPTPPAADGLRKAPQDRVVQSLGITAARVDDLEVFRWTGERVGEAEDVVEDAAGQVVGLVVEIGGALTGEEEYIVPIERLSLRGLRLTTDLTLDEIRQLRRWTD